MLQALPWLIVLALIALMIWSLTRENGRQKRRTAQEYEQDLVNHRDSMLRAGMLQLDQFAGNVNEKRAAVEFLKDEEQGVTKTGSKGDDKDRTSEQE
jgi:Tfp pilus assembly protein PilX